MQTTQLKLDEQLPLTCSRKGTCCHGNVVMLNPWELYALARTKNISSKEFRSEYCDMEGIQLKFNGPKNSLGKQACSQYVENFGCSLHAGRPLACRLFPLGRQIQNEKAHYMFQGTEFPCLNGCKEVLKLPKLSVQTYIKEQNTAPYEKAQDAYLEVMQNIADIAFELLLETGLAESGDKKTLALWRKMGKESASELAKRIGTNWMDILLTPAITSSLNDPNTFVQNHFELLQISIQDKFSVLKTNMQLHEAAVLVMGLALFLARSIGANPTELANYWADTAVNFGAQE
ncbi:YkgJ family cysteine cluster protein [Putridiphycobacter roseus]|uniref:YkgJ family cysteine cluster protein n=1 Tax=Putridiphycobacter roseus TaxID=2219161 RepID=A0A2W1NS01_9FLAO|nr:YkgJ family cysteine cluster protein [Putridiphycobacter roseus]PZE18422.1 YkgJ family cysteine cluster protein [Putridiphycobacter roseus]